MNAPDKLPPPPEPHVMKTYGRLPVALSHGRGCWLWATGNPKVQAGFEPLVEGFVRVPLNDAPAIERIAATEPDVVAVFLEVIQGEGGINPTKIEYLQQVRRICDERGWLLMLDEVQ